MFHNRVMQLAVPVTLVQLPESVLVMLDAKKAPKEIEAPWIRIIGLVRVMRSNPKQKILGHV